MTDDATDAGVEAPSSWATIRKGLSLSPELRVGLAGTLGLSLVAMTGRAAVPIAVQQVIDRGIRGPGGPNLGLVVAIVAATVCVLGVTALCSYLMMRRVVPGYADAPGHPACPTVPRHH